MTNWQTRKLGDIGRIEMCKRIMKDQTSPSGDIPFYKIGTFGKEPDAYISKDLYKNYKSKYSFPKTGEILISASGTIGRAVVYDGKPAYFQDSNIVWLAHDESIILNKFLSYVYHGVNWKTDSGTIARLYNDNFRRVTIRIPEKQEQERIVAVLHTWDKYIEKLEQKIMLKEQLKKGLMQQLLTGKSRLPNFTKQWRPTLYSDICKFQSGFAFSSKDFSKTSGVRLIRNRDLKDNTAKLFYKGTPPASYLIEDGDILVGMDGDFIVHRWHQGEALLNQRVGRLTNFTDSYPEFIFYNSQRHLKQIENETSSTTVKHLSAKEFEKRQILIPAPDEQKAIANILVNSDEEISLLCKKKYMLREQREYLLKNLITGTIRTPENLKSYEARS